MAISVDWANKVIQVPKADLTLLQEGPPEIRQLDLNTFRTTLNALQESEEGMPFDTTHLHTAPTTLAGITFARVIEIINDYTIEFEDLQYTVNVVGGNSNIGDVKVQNQVSVNTANSGGLVVTAADLSGVASAVWDDNEVPLADRTVNTEQLSGSTTAATNLATAEHVLPIGTVDATLLAPTATMFDCDLVAAINDALVGRVVIFISGNLKGHPSDIKVYEIVSGRGRLTVSEMPEAPAEGDQFVLH